MTTGKQSRSQFQATIDPPDEIRHLRSQVSELEGRLAERRKTSGHIIEAMTAVTQAVEVAQPPKTQYTPPKTERRVSRPVVHVIQLTDWHIGQFTDGAQIEEFGENNWAMSQARVAYLLQAILKHTEVQRHGFRCDECVVIGTADWVSGNIHEELTTTNEFPCPVQAVNAGYLLGSFLVGLSAHFKSVRAEIMTNDNHGRITRKPQNEDGGLNNWGYVTGVVAKQHASQCTNVTVNLHSVGSAIVEVVGQRYLVSHGDGILGTWGIPFYGIERKKQREAMARMNMPADKHFHRIVIGHFHSALNHEHWYIGGSLTGTTAYDHKEGRHARPHQTSWWVHPSHGDFSWSRFYLDQAKQASLV